MRIFSKVKLFWPLGAFVFAAMLVAVFLSAQANRKDELSAEELRRIRYETALQNARWMFDRLEYLKAGEAFEKIGRNYADLLDPDIHLEIARAIYCHNPDRTTSINSHLEKFIDHYKGTPKEREADALRGEMLNREGKYAEALDLLQRAIEPETSRLKEHVRIYMELGRACYYLENYLEAEIWLEEVVRYPKIARDVAQANFLLGEIYAHTAADNPGNLRKAIGYFSRVKSDNQYPGLQYAARVRIADVLLLLEDYGQAQETYLWALDVLPSEAGMKEFLPQYDKESGQEELKLAQIIGRPASKDAAATKLECVIAHYVADSEEKTAGDLLVLIAGKVQEGSGYFMRAASLYKFRADRLLTEIEKLQAIIAQRSSRLAELISEDAMAHMRETIAAKEKERQILLTLAAKNYVSAFDANPFGKYGEPDVLDHPLWHAAMILCERKAYASAKDVLTRMIEDALTFKPVLTLNAYLALGDIFREEGDYTQALKMYGFIVNYQVGSKDNTQAQNDFRAQALLRQALTLLDAGRYDEAEKGLKDLLGVEGERYGIFSRIYMGASFALGRLTYFRAMATETGKRMKAFCDAAEKLRESLEFYKGIADAQTIEQARFYLAASLHLAAIEALRSEQKVAAAKWFVEARGFLEQIVSRDISAQDTNNVFYRISRLLYADTFFFEASLSQDPAEREDLLCRAVGEYGAVADALQDAEQGVWARVQMAVVYRLLGEDQEADRQFDMAAAASDKIDKTAGSDTDRLGNAYIRKQIEWFRKTRAKAN